MPLEFQHIINATRAAYYLAEYNSALRQEVIESAIAVLGSGKTSHAWRALALFETVSDWNMHHTYEPVIASALVSALLKLAKDAEYSDRRTLVRRTADLLDLESTIDIDRAFLPIAEQFPSTRVEEVKRLRDRIASADAHTPEPTRPTEAVVIPAPKFAPPQHKGH